MSNNELQVSEVENYADFNLIRYAQVWEDAEILIKGLRINENDNVLSIASAGENALSLLTQNPKKVYAIDLNENQIACTELKKMAYKYLEYEECMKLIGVFDCEDRLSLYNKIKEHLEYKVMIYFDSHEEFIKNGIIHMGKFEHYFQIFGQKVLPIIHSQKVNFSCMLANICHCVPFLYFYSF